MLKVVLQGDDVKINKTKLLFLSVLYKLGNTDKKVNNYNIVCIIIEVCAKSKAHTR